MHWIRGWETWQMQERDIVKKVLNVPTIKLVNSIGLKEKLKEHSIDSYIVRPGYDIESYKPLGIREKNKKIIIGGLYNAQRNNQKKRTVWLFQCMRKIKTRRSDVELWLFGNNKKPEGFLVNNYLRRPTLEQKNEFYNHINIWLAPTALEGLHMPPAESMLTGCPVIGTNSKLNGMHDYLINGETGIVTKNKDEDFYKKLFDFLDEKELQIQLGKNGREKIIQLGSRKENMEKFTELLRRLKDESV